MVKKDASDIIEFMLTRNYYISTASDSEIIHIASKLTSSATLINGYHFIIFFYYTVAFLSGGLLIPSNDNSLS